MDKKNQGLFKAIKKAKNKYTEDHFVLAIPGFMARSFTSFCSMREDLLLIKESIKRLESEADEIICASLTYSSISLYGKCFTDASNTKAPKLEPSQLFQEGTEFQATHDFLMNLRHNFIAHRGDTESEIEVAYLLVPKLEGEPQVRFTRTKQMKFSPDEREKIRELVEYLLDEIVEKIKRQAKSYTVLISRILQLSK